MATHPFNKSKLGFKLFLFKNRIKSVRRDILILAAISIISILLIEFWFINIPAPYSYFHVTGVVYLKLCYSFFSAFLFYYLVVHLPKEKRKFNSYRLISNKVTEIGQRVYTLLDVLLGDISPADINDIRAETIKAACEKTNPNTKVSAHNFDSLPYLKVTYNNWFDLLNHTATSIRVLVRDLIVLNDSIDTKVLGALTHLDDTTKWLFYKQGLVYTNLSFASHHLVQLRNESFALRKSVSKAYKFTIEYHSIERKKNLELMKLKKV